MRPTRLRPEQVDQILRSRVSARYFEVGDWMIAALPELSAVFEDYLANWGSGPAPGAINIADEIFVPFVEQILQDDGKEELLARALSFIETLAADPEAEIREVAQETVNSLAPSARFLRARSRMGVKTQELFRRSVGTSD